jgi:hypothetical protein
MHIRWDDVSQQMYDDMVSVLLSRLHPDSQRIDGRGGDGGRDVQFGSGDNLSIFQLKSFKGRMDPGRRAQVKKSLSRAAKSKPAQWTLVVPIDPTPKELEWFEKLGSTVPFPITWRGQNWLDSEMAARPEIYRYFVEDARAEVVALLLQLNQEQAAITTVTDVVTRALGLHARLNEIDPHFRYDLTTGRAAAGAMAPGAVFSALIDGVRINVYERYHGALDDRPITVSLQLSFRAEDADLKDAFVHSMDFGTPVSIPPHVVQELRFEAPGGLGGSYAGALLEIAAAKPHDLEQQTMHAHIDDEERTLASLPFTLKVKTAGQKGVILEGQDHSGWIRAELTIHLQENRLNFNISIQPSLVMPSALVPVFRWLANLRSPNTLGLRWEAGITATAAIPSTEAPFDDHVCDLVEALDDIQRLTRVYFEMPLDLSNEEANEILSVRELLSGDPVSGTWSSMSFEIKPGLGADFTPLLSDAGAAAIVDRDEELELRGHRVPLGRIRTQFSSVRASDPDGLRRDLEGGKGSILVQLTPGASADLTRRRIL